MSEVVHGKMGPQSSILRTLLLPGLCRTPQEEATEAELGLYTKNISSSPHPYPVSWLHSHQILGTGDSIKSETGSV